MKVAIGYCLFAAIAAGTTATGLPAQQTGSIGDIQTKLNAEFAVTKVLADRSDIVTPGSVLVLHKDGLVMYSTPTQTPPLNVYKDGRIQQNAAKDYFRGLGSLMVHGGDSTDLDNIPHRKFVAGEKFWISGINVQPDGVVFTVYSDPFGDFRYYGLLKFPFPKKSIPATSDLVRAVEEVITVMPTENAAASAPQPPQGPPAPLPPVLPPPPPADQPPAPPKTISVGQSKTVVIATWGQPLKDIKLSNKEVLVFPDMKVTFVAGKVSDVQ